MAPRSLHSLAVSQQSTGLHRTAVPPPQRLHRNMPPPLLACCARIHVAAQVRPHRLWLQRHCRSHCRHRCYSQRAAPRTRLSGGRGQGVPVRRLATQAPCHCRRRPLRHWRSRGSSAPPPLRRKNTAIQQSHGMYRRCHSGLAPPPRADEPGRRSRVQVTPRVQTLCRRAVRTIVPCGGHNNSASVSQWKETRVAWCQRVPQPQGEPPSCSGGRG